MISTQFQPWIQIGGAVAPAVLLLALLAWRRGGGFLAALLPPLLGALLGMAGLTLLIWLGRLPEAVGALRAGLIAAGEVPRAAFTAYSWFPILTPVYAFFGVLGSLAAGGAAALFYRPVR